MHGQSEAISLTLDSPIGPRVKDHSELFDPVPWKQCAHEVTTENS